MLQLLVERMNLVAEEQYPEEIISKRPRIWADLDGYNSPNNYPRHIPKDLRERYRPDIIIVKKTDGKRILTFVELTCPYEDNLGLEKAHERKKKKYLEFIRQIKLKTEAFHEINLHCVEVGARGHLATSLHGINHLIALVKKGVPNTETFLRTLGRASLKGSILIYRDRNKLFREGRN